MNHPTLDAITCDFCGAPFKLASGSRTADLGANLLRTTSPREGEPGAVRVLALIELGQPTVDVCVPCFRGEALRRRDERAASSSGLGDECASCEGHGRVGPKGARKVCADCRGQGSVPAKAVRA